MYKFKTEPYAHQKAAFQDSWAKPYYFLAMEMGTGKSKVAIDSIGALYKRGDIDTVLIVAPKGVFDNWIQQEIPRHLPDDIKEPWCDGNPIGQKNLKPRLQQLLFRKSERLSFWPFW